MIISIENIYMSTIINICSKQAVFTGPAMKSECLFTLLIYILNLNFQYTQFFFIIYMYLCERSCSFIAATLSDKIQKSFNSGRFFYNISIIYILTARFTKFSILYLCMNIERRL